MEASQASASHAVPLLDRRPPRYIPDALVADQLVHHYARHRYCGGGPSISWPCFAASRLSFSMPGGPSRTGKLLVRAGSPISRTKFMKSPLGARMSQFAGCSTLKVCGTPLGMRTNDPDAALKRRAPQIIDNSPSST